MVFAAGLPGCGVAFWAAELRGVAEFRMGCENLMKMIRI